MATKKRDKLVQKIEEIKSKLPESFTYITFKTAGSEIKTHSYTSLLEFMSVNSQTRDLFPSEWRLIEKRYFLASLMANKLFSKFNRIQFYSLVYSN